MAIGSGENRCVFRFRVEWAMWGNMNALYAAAIMFVGGVVAATVEIINSTSLPVHQYGAVTRWIVIPISMFIFFIEYPRSKRREKPRPVERPGQQYIAPLIHITGPIGRNYIIRSLVYLVAFIPCIFVLSAILGAMCLTCASICYFIAALNGEEWRAPSLAWGPGSKKEEETDQPGHTLPPAPTTIAPRLNPNQMKQAPPSYPPPRPQDSPPSRAPPRPNLAPPASRPPHLEQ